MSLSDGFKKLTLAAIGAGAITYEKTSEIVDQLVKKGEITVDQGKAINTELKHNVKDSVERQKEIVKEAAEKAKAEVQAKREAKADAKAGILNTSPNEVVDDAAKAAKDLIDVISRLSAEQLDSVKKAIESMNTSEKKAEAPASEGTTSKETASEETAAEDEFEDTAE